MSTVSVSELKARLSEYLHEARRGGEVVVLDRGAPVARITGIAGADVSVDERRRHLIRVGLLRPGRRGAASWLDEPALDMEADISGALEQGRDDRL